MVCSFLGGRGGGVAVFFLRGRRRGAEVNLKVGGQGRGKSGRLGNRSFRSMLLIPRITGRNRQDPRDVLESDFRRRSARSPPCRLNGSQKFRNSFLKEYKNLAIDQPKTSAHFLGHH